MEGLTEGRIVHFVMPNSACRPAIVVRVWDKTSPSGCVQLQVFTDNTNDGVSENVLWRTSVLYSALNIPYSWHWPERA